MSLTSNTNTFSSSADLKSQKKFDFGSPPSPNVQSAIEILRQFPYKYGALASRNWGHERHSICSFASKMKPSLASTLVALFTAEDSTVLDPFTGCGTIPFEASLQGRRSIGGDVSPLATVLTAAKIRPPEEVEVLSVLDSMSRRIESFWQNVDTCEMEPEIRD